MVLANFWSLPLSLLQPQPQQVLMVQVLLQRPHPLQPAAFYWSQTRSWPSGWMLCGRAKRGCSTRRTQHSALTSSCLASGALEWTIPGGSSRRARCACSSGWERSSSRSGSAHSVRASAGTSWGQRSCWLASLSSSGGSTSCSFPDGIQTTRDWTCPARRWPTSLRVRGRPVHQLYHRKLLSPSLHRVLPQRKTSRSNYLLIDINCNFYDLLRCFEVPVRLIHFTSKALHPFYLSHVQTSVFLSSLFSLKILFSLLFEIFLWYFVSIWNTRIAKFIHFSWISNSFRLLFCISTVIIRIRITRNR